VNASAEVVFGRFYASDDLGDRHLPDNTAYLEANGVMRPAGEGAARLGQRFATRLAAGETLYLLGFLATAHDSGVALISVSEAAGISVLANCEEERFSGLKHYAGYPAAAVSEVVQLMRCRGVSPQDLFGCFYAFDTVQEEQGGMRMVLANTKVVRNQRLRMYTDIAGPSPDLGAEEQQQVRKNLFSHSPAMVAALRRLRADLGRPDLPCVQMLHHENHAYAAYGSSPFAEGSARGRKTLVVCVDGGGDLASTSLFEADATGLRLVRRQLRVNSLGTFFLLCGMLLGGWTALNDQADARSDNRYMGVAGYGNGDRLTNPYYKRLRQMFHFAADGEVFLNSAMAENAFAGLEAVTGPFVFWLGDRRDIRTSEAVAAEMSCERVDVAAAVQMTFEDALCHIVGDFVQKTGAEQVVLCGSAGLNDVANMRLLDHFGPGYYRATFGREGRLRLWIPPFSADQGTVIGAPYQFAMLHGGRPQGRLPTPFLCGLAPTRSEIEAALAEDPDIVVEPCGDIGEAGARAELADWMAFVVGQGAVIGLFQGEAETGPRALGHRSILSNPCNPATLEVLNSRVKLREKIRPLAPMVTPEEAGLWFELSPGAAAADYDAYSYMVLTAQAKPEARQRIPAVVHHDGTSRLQIVRRENNPLVYDYLKALKRHIGVEVSVNTSLNVGTPIVQTPSQALTVFRRSKGIDAIFFVADDGAAFMAYAKPGVQARDSDIPRLKTAYTPRSVACV